PSLAVQLQPDSSLSHPPFTVSKINVDKLEPTQSIQAKPASPKVKVPRHCLFERQLSVDQESCMNPDYHKPFHGKYDAVKRLIRYHCLYAQDEDPQSDEEEYFHKIADCFQHKFKDMTNKYQSLLMKDSSMHVKTSELMMIDRMFNGDIQEEILNLQIDISNSMANANAFNKVMTTQNVSRREHEQ
ncbi:BRD4-interacting chromatin-remodeling complex-associated protein-like, partial [Pseudolycoriella hygida]